MANLNRIILIGRLTADAESRATVDGLPMAKFRLAVNRPQGEADFVDIIAWRGAAEACGSLKKGQLALVEGRIQIRSFEDQTGQRRWVTEVVARIVQPLDNKQAQAGGVSAQQAPEEALDDIDLSSDLPF